MEGLLIIVVLVVAVAFIRGQFVKTKRTMHNSWRSLTEGRPMDDIESEEDARRIVNRFFK